MTDVSAPDWPEEPALFLDLDGTLLDFALIPSDVRLPDRLKRALRGLPEVTGGALAFISGRTLDDLDRLLGPGRFALAGVHGLQRRTAQGARLDSTPDVENLEHARGMFRGIAAQHPQVIFEDKESAVALHYRRCPEIEGILINKVQDGLAAVRSSIVLMTGKMVLEAKPETANKGTAIEAFMAEPPFRGRTPVFIGDDATDEDGFRVVNKLGGVSVKVDSGETVARCRLPDPDAVVDWLEELVARQ